MHAASRGHKEAVEVLIDHGADLNKQEVVVRIFILVLVFVHNHVLMLFRINVLLWSWLLNGITFK